MNPVEKIRSQHKTNLLQGLALKPHRKRIVHLDDIRSIGVIAHGLNDEEQVTLSQFSHHLTNRGVMVKKIVLPANAEEQLDKFGIPKSEYTQLFTSYHYDLLIDATPTDDLFGLYVTLNTSSNLRVVYQDKQLPYQDITLTAYDLIFLGNGAMDLSKYLTDVLNYLIQIKKVRTRRIETESNTNNIQS